MKPSALLLLVLMLSLLLAVSFRGWLFTHLVGYHITGSRSEYRVTDAGLLALLEEGESHAAPPAIGEIVERCLILTTDRLNFTTGPSCPDPNRLIYTRRAHCVGYAALFTTACNHLLRKHRLDGTWKAVHRVGMMTLAGYSLHSLTPSRFWKDHDFVTLENRYTGAIRVVDPLAEEFWVSREW